MGIKSEPRSQSIYANITKPYKTVAPPRMLRVMADSSCIGLQGLSPVLTQCDTQHCFSFWAPKSNLLLENDMPNAHSTKLLHPDTPLPSLSPTAYPTARAHRFLLDPLAKHGHALARSPRHQGRCPRDTLPRSFHHLRWVLSDPLAVQLPRHQGPACSGKFLCNQLPSSYHVSTSFHSKARLLVKNSKSWCPKSSRTIPTSATSSRRSSCLPLALAPHNEGCDRSHLQPPKGHICQRWAQVQGKKCKIDIYIYLVIHYIKTPCSLSIWLHAMPCSTLAFSVRKPSMTCPLLGGEKVTCNNINRMTKHVSWP